MSATFGETRSAHFHSALDLKTWGRKGYEVYATRDGELHRISIGPTGYGKVIYLKHDDGSFSVYAHLLRFEEEIQKLADAIRFKDYRFELNQWLGHRNIRVKKGDLIGLTGASGIGPPHLHFELRTPDNDPFNPLLTNLEVKDDVPPQFSNLSLEPLSIRSKIEGENHIYTKRAYRSNGRYDFGTIDVSGPVGVGMDVFDQANDVYNAYAVYQLEMYVDGELYFQSKIDRFSYAETGQMLIDRVYPLLKESRAGYQRLYVSDGNTLPFYSGLKNRGKLDLSPGLHQVKVVARDYFGNTSEAQFQLRVEKNEEQPVDELSKTHSGNELFALKPESWSWFERWVNLPEEDFSRITITPLGQGGASTQNIVQQNGSKGISLNLEGSRDIFFRSSYKEHFIARQVVPQKSAIVPSTTDNSFAVFQPHTFYDTLSVGLTQKTFSPDSIRLHLFPDSHPTKKSFRLAVDIDSAQSALLHLGVYSYDQRRDKYSYLPSETRGNYLWTEPEEPGVFYILQDLEPPLVEDPKLVRRTDGQWLVYATVTDNRSGIDYARSEFYVNGLRGIAEYEPEDDRLVYYHPDFSPANEHNLRIVVYDLEGNRTEKHFYLSEGIRQ